MMHVSMTHTNARSHSLLKYSKQLRWQDLQYVPSFDVVGHQHASGANWEEYVAATTANGNKRCLKLLDTLRRFQFIDDLLCDDYASYGLVSLLVQRAYSWSSFLLFYISA